MKSEEKKFIPERPARHLHWCFFDVYKIKIVKITMAFFFAVLFLATIWDICEILSKFNSINFIIYWPSFFIKFYWFVCIIFVFYFCKVVERVEKKYPKWLSNIKVDELKKISVKSWSETTVLCSVVLFSCLLCSIFFLIPTEGDRDFFHCFSFTDEWKIPIGYLAGRCCILFTFKFQMPCFQMAYCTVYKKLRVYCLIQHLENINMNFENVGQEKLIFDENYQKIIEQRLTYCVKRHNECLDILKMAIEDGAIFMFSITVSGALTVISFVLYIILNSDVSILIYIRLITFVLASAFTGVYYTLQGQGIEDVYNSLYFALTNMEWYNWNNTNQKIYLTFLTATSKPVKVKFSENFCYNYLLGANVAKTVYTICCVMSQVYRQ